MLELLFVLSLLAASGLAFRKAYRAGLISGRFIAVAIVAPLLYFAAGAMIAVTWGGSVTPDRAWLALVVALAYVAVPLGVLIWFARRSRVKRRFTRSA
jgi:hypothetical protein